MRVEPVSVRSQPLEIVHQPVDLLEALGHAEGERHRTGKVPGPACHQVPRCPGTDRRLHTVAWIDLADPALGVAPEYARLGGLPIWAALDCAVSRDPLAWQRTAPARFELVEPPELEPFDDAPTEIAAASLAFREADPFPPPDAPLHRLGGEPLWVEEERSPSCPICGAPLSFLLQLDSDPRIGWRFGDQGTLYAFVCAPCALVASLIQEP